MNWEKCQDDDLRKHGQVKERNNNELSPVVLVKNANSGEYWFAVDYRKLNKIRKPQTYPISTLSDIFDAIWEANAQYFSFDRYYLVKKVKHVQHLLLIMAYINIKLCPLTYLELLLPPALDDEGPSSNLM